MTRPDLQLRAATLPQLREHAAVMSDHRDNFARAARAAKSEIRRRERAKKGHKKP